MEGSGTHGSSCALAKKTVRGIFHFAYCTPHSGHTCALQIMPFQTYTTVRLVGLLLHYNLRRLDPTSQVDIRQVDPPPCKSECKGQIRIIVGSYDIPIILLLQGGGLLLRHTASASPGFAAEACHGKAM